MPGKFAPVALYVITVPGANFPYSWLVGKFAPGVFLKPFLSFAKKTVFTKFVGNLTLQNCVLIKISASCLVLPLGGFKVKRRREKILVK